jgi:hypothetical protein
LDTLKCTRLDEQRPRNVRRMCPSSLILAPRASPPPRGVAQLSAALRAVHAAGLAVRPACLSPSKVLVLPLGRLRIGCLGLAEALAGDVAPGQEELLQAQRDDVMVSWGRAETVRLLWCAGKCSGAVRART